MRSTRAARWPASRARRARRERPCPARSPRGARRPRRSGAPPPGRRAGRRGRARRPGRGRRRGSPPRPRARRARASSVGPVGAREERRAAGDEAVAAVVEVSGQAASRAARSATLRRGRITASASGVRGAAAPPSGSSRSSRTRSPARTTTRTTAVSRRRSAAPTVRAAGAPPGPPMLPYPGPAGPSFPAGTTTSVSSRRRARDRARDRPVGERGERLGDADDRDARRVEHVAVGVGVDRQLEAGEQLVGAAVDGEPAFGARLPAGDADRQDRRAGRDAPDATRTAAADEQAGDLRAVALEPRRLVRVRARDARDRRDRARRPRRAAGRG